MYLQRRDWPAQMTRGRIRGRTSRGSRGGYMWVIGTGFQRTDCSIYMIENKSLPTAEDVKWEENILSGLPLLLSNPSLPFSQALNISACPASSLMQYKGLVHASV